jgi:hypothetical protein
MSTAAQQMLAATLFILSSSLIVSPALGTLMTKKSRLMAALIVLLARFATAATARSRKDNT